MGGAGSVAAMSTLFVQILSVLAFLVCLGALEMVWALMRAPEGYQDRGGFHYARGSEPMREGFTQTPWNPGLTA